MGCKLELTRHGVACTGDVDRSNVTKLEAAIIDVLDGGSDMTVVDLTGVTFIHSSAIDTLLATSDLARGGLVVKASRQVWRVLDVAGVLRSGTIRVKAAPGVGFRPGSA